MSTNFRDNVSARSTLKLANAFNLVSPLVTKFLISRLPLGLHNSSSRGRTAHTEHTLLMSLENVRKHFDRVGRLRILVIGRVNLVLNALKSLMPKETRLLTHGDSQLNPVILQHGLIKRTQSEYLDIEDELVFQSNPGLIFHDSQGFDIRIEHKMNVVRDFIGDRAVTTKLENRIHAIWFCIPLTEYERSITTLEECFFDKWNTANVPVIVVLTKADWMKRAAIGQLRDEGLTMKEAMLGAESLATQLLSEVKTRIENKLAGFWYPPKGCLTLSWKYQLVVLKLMLTSLLCKDTNKVGADCEPPLRCTRCLFYGMVSRKLVISTQQVDISPYIEYTVKMDLTRQLRKESNYPCTAGAFGDIWKCY
ncbi:hypothetical protein V8B97DRAFT_1917050 [Scleroderma yunnanense]